MARVQNACNLCCETGMATFYAFPIFILLKPFELLLGYIKCCAQDYINVVWLKVAHISGLL